MYNLAKLLTEEPAKLEKLIILLFKLLITFFFTCLLFGYSFSIQSLIKDPLPPSLSTTKLIYFFLGIFVVWYLLWRLCGEVIIGDLLIRLLAWPWNKRKTFVEILSFIGVAKESYGYLNPKKHIIVFSEALMELDKEETDKFISENHSRLREYFVLSFVVFVLLLLTKDVQLSRWQIWVCSIMLVNFLLGCTFFHLMKGYIYDNLESLKREFEPIAYAQKALNAICENKELMQYFEKPTEAKSIFLKKKEGMNYGPAEIRVRSMYHWNQILGQMALEDTFIKWGKAERKREEGLIEICISNITPTQDMERSVKNLDGFLYIHATSEKEIFSGLEEAWYIIQRRERLRSKIKFTTT